MSRHRWVRLVAAFLAYAAVAGLIGGPIALERAIERARFTDRLGSLPVEVSLAHNGVSTLDTGFLGQLYWAHTGAGGFGAHIRATGPPEAGGTLSSYITPAFLKANAQFVNDPDEVARVYGAELRASLWHELWRTELLIAVLGGAVLMVAFRGRRPAVPAFVTGAWARRGVLAGGLVVAVAASSLVALQQFRSWGGSQEAETTLAMPGFDDLSFSSPQTLEVARQIQPFIEKNTARIEADAREYQEAAVASLQVELAAQADALAPREGERIVIAEADPQGSLVGTRVRREFYQLLQEALGADAFALRTISGDVTSNGTVAESGFVEDEASASPDIPTVAVKGDHDTDVTVDQMTAAGIIVPDLEIEEVDGLDVAVSNDPNFKSLFGGMVTAGEVSEAEAGAELRPLLDSDQSAIVLFHQPRTAAGYLGVPSLEDLPAQGEDLTTPHDDGIPDLPPGIINIGHLHDAHPPRVIWNTDGDTVTWTVLNQLGTSGGVLEAPTFNRFSTPFSVPLKKLAMQLQYVDEAGLETGYVPIDVSVGGTVTIGDRTDIGLPAATPTS